MKTRSDFTRMRTLNNRFQRGSSTKGELKDLDRRGADCDASLLPRERIKVSSLLYPGDPSMRETLRETLALRETESLLLQYSGDIFSGRHQEKDSDGQPIPEIMRKV
jgi:hypothetical protein